MFTLRRYQQEAVQSTLTDLESYSSTGIIAPTGAGKTVMMLEIATEYLKAMGSGYNVILLSHLSILQRQTMIGFQKHSKYKVGKLQGEDKPHPLSRIIISTMQTMRNQKHHDHIARRLIHNDTCLIMIDEAQMYGAASYKKIEQLYPNAKIVGLSASPYRGNTYSFNQFDTVSYSISLQELIDQGYLAKPVLHTIEMAGQDVPEKISHIIALIKATIEDDPGHDLGRGSLCYWNTKDNAKLAANSFTTAGIPSAFITDKTSPIRREKILEQFETGEIKVIHNVNVLSAGYDSTNVFNIFMPMGTSSPVNYIQRIGRGLRLHKEKKQCNVYCYGDAPTIKRNLYQRIHRISLKVSDDPDLGKKGDIYDKLEWMELNESNYSKEKIIYTKQCIEIAERMKALNAENIYKLVRFQKFPKRYLRSLLTANARLDLKERKTVSDVQKNWLKDKGIDNKCIDSMNKAEAQMLIGLIQKSMSAKWVVKYGLHANKPIDEVPMAYIGSLVKQRNYNHPVFKLYKEWKEKGKPSTI